MKDGFEKSDEEHKTNPSVNAEINLKTSANGTA